MRKFLICLMGFLFLSISTHAQTLKGGVSEDYIPKGFFGSWGVISKLKNSNNPSLFNFESRDIWSLSGHNNILILENLESGARSEIEIKNKSIDTLKFERKKEVATTDGKIIYREIVVFKLTNNNFSGTDKFIVEKYAKNGTFLEKNEANYFVEGVKISGEAPNLD